MAAASVHPLWQAVRCVALKGVGDLPVVASDPMQRVGGCASLAGGACPASFRRAASSAPPGRILFTARKRARVVWYSQPDVAARLRRGVGILTVC
jgi:hypothetical protein